MIAGYCRTCKAAREVDDPVGPAGAEWPQCCGRPMVVVHFEIQSRRKDEHDRMLRDLVARKPKRLTWRRRA